MKMVLKRILDKAETTRSLLVFVKSHDDFLNISTFGEELVDLFLSSVK
jgi:hypothetical protein